MRMKMIKIWKRQPGSHVDWCTGHHNLHIMLHAIIIHHRCGNKIGILYPSKLKSNKRGAGVRLEMLISFHWSMCPRWNPPLIVLLHPHSLWPGCGSSGFASCQESVFTRSVAMCCHGPIFCAHVWWWDQPHCLIYFPIEKPVNPF